MKETVIAHVPVAVSGYTVGSADDTARNLLQDETCSGVGGRSRYRLILAVRTEKAWRGGQRSTLSCVDAVGSVGNGDKCAGHLERSGRT